jgi:hypothetical protein
VAGRAAATTAGTQRDTTLGVTVLNLRKARSPTYFRK